MTEHAAVHAQSSPQTRSSASPNPNRAPRARRHPLLGAFPLTVMTLATFLVLFTVMMARLTAGADPALRAANAPALVQRASTGAPLRTHASGSAAVAGTTPVAATGQAPATAQAVVTRSSASASAGVGTDD